MDFDLRGEHKMLKDPVVREAARLMAHHAACKADQSEDGRRGRFVETQK